MTKTIKLTAFQAKALRLVRDENPATPSEVGQALWPDRRFKSAQGAALAGGSQMGKLAKLGLIRRTYERYALDDRMWPRGWKLLPAGVEALRRYEEGGHE